MTDSTIPTQRLLPLATTGCACCAPASPGADRTTGPEVPAASPASRTFRIAGMTCGHCAGRVTDALTALEGVADVQVELVPGDSSTVTVSGDRPVPTEAVRTAVEQAGYTLAES